MWLRAAGFAYEQRPGDRVLFRSFFKNTVWEIFRGRERPLERSFLLKISTSESRYTYPTRDIPRPYKNAEGSDFRTKFPAAVRGALFLRAATD